MFHLLAYEGNNAGPANNFDLTAAGDPIFSQRNGHYTFSEQYQLLYAATRGLTLTDARFQAPTWNAIGEPRIDQFQLTAELPGNPPLARCYTQLPWQIPLEEELQVQVSQSAANRAAAGLVIGTSGWNRNLPSGFPVTVEATTAAFTPAAFVWSGGQNLVLTQALRGGVYAVVGAQAQFAADVLFFRLIFPRTPLQVRRALRPGWIAQNAIGDQLAVVQQQNPYHLGVWGAFHTFEFPQVETFNVVAAATTLVVRLDLVYLGPDINLLDSFLSSLR